MSEAGDRARLLKVAQVESDGFEVVLNAGLDAGIKLGDKFVVYRRGKRIVDPDTGEDLGILETVIGPGLITHVQERLSVLRSTSKVTLPARILKRHGILNMLETEEVRPQTEEVPFRNPKIGDLVKRV